MAIDRKFCQVPVGHFFLFGPRGTGKTSWLRRVFRESVWIDLLDPAQHRRYLARPERLREVAAGTAEGSDIVVDEVQRAPQILPVVHQLIETRGCPRFVLTGSSARKLKRGGVDLLAGRATVRTMHPFIAAELGQQFDLGSAVTLGMLPLVWDAGDPSDTLGAYVGLYVQQEVQSEGVVRNIGAFHRFLEAISFAHGSPLNVSEVARECAVSRKTVSGFVEILEDLLLAYRIPVFTRRARRRMTAHPKFYFADAGVFRSLRPSGPLDTSEEIDGAALEGLLAQHLRAWIDYSASGAKLGHWRTRAGSEVDFVVYGPGEFWAAEVKRARRVRARDLRGLKAFREDFPEARVRFVYGGEERLVTGGILCLPIRELLASIVPGRALP